jgi:hypothetical protein
LAFRACCLRSDTVCYHTFVLVDAGPLMYLAKLDALDVFANSGHEPLITPEIEREAARPGLAYEHPDSLLIAEALRSGVLRRTVLDDGEAEVARRLLGHTGTLKLGEAEVLAAGQSRRIPVLLFERRAIRVAGSLGLERWGSEQLLLAGTRDLDQLRRRLIAFAKLVDRPFANLDHVMNRAEELHR